MANSELKCERCGTDSQYLEYCGQCGRKSCQKCVKSSKRASKTERAIICKDCWSDCAKRKKYQRA